MMTNELGILRAHGWILTDRKQEARFEMHTQSRKLYMFCDTPAEADRWVTTLLELIDSYTTGARVRVPSKPRQERERRIKGERLLPGLLGLARLADLAPEALFTS